MGLKAIQILNEMLRHRRVQELAHVGQPPDSHRRIIKCGPARVEIPPHADDGDARQYLMQAYEQKAMLYEMALDRSLP